MRKKQLKCLDGNWRLINDDFNIKIIGNVPGSVYESLRSAQIIEDPYFADNEKKIDWIYKSDWIYETDFEINDEILNYKNIILRFLGIDTISKVYLNGKLIGETENMFLRYDFDVKNELKVGKNTLRVIIESPLKIGKNKIKKYGYQLINFYETPGVPYLRKAQYGFGWDIGLNLPDMGIWKSVNLIAFKDLLIDFVNPIVSFKHPIEEYVKTQTYLNVYEIEIPVYIHIDIETYSINQDCSVLNYEIFIQIEDPDGNVCKYDKMLLKEKITFEIEINKAKLWWTNNLGKSNLYTLSISIFDEDVVVDSTDMKFGIRELKLVREDDDFGESFYFILNGIPLFIKGANWVPVDMMIDKRSKEETYIKVLKSIRKANINMIRVWGGGIYEDDFFYELCDRLGILVWQDFPFACAVYPPTKDFMKQVKKEATYNIRRLRHHPSLGIWCGNNEVELLFKIEVNISGITELEEVDIFRRGYIELFEEVLPLLLQELDSNRPYWPSSPSSGSIKEQVEVDDSNDQTKGDMHYYGVWHYKDPVDKYRSKLPRFMSEFGLVSFPDIKTIRSVCPKEQLDFNSSIIEFINKDKRGKNRKVKKYIKKRFRFPKKFENQLIMSQIMQGDGLKYGIEYWRFNRQSFRCMGTLYWQVNDCYPGISWGTLDYYVRWKASHYLIKRVYKPIILFIYQIDGKIEIWSINDDFNKKETILTYTLRDCRSDILFEKIIQKKIKPLGLTLLDSIYIEEVLTDDVKREDVILFYSLKEKKTGKIIYSSDFFIFTVPKNFSLEDPELSYKIEEKIENSNNSMYKVQVNSNKVALYVNLQSDKVDFIVSDNFFALEPNKPKYLTLEIQKTGIELKKEDIEIKSLYNLTRYEK